MDMQGPGMQPMEPMTLGLLYRKHAPALRLYARQWAGHSEDIVQDAFVRLAQQTPPPIRVLPWLYRVVRNQALSDHRQALRRRRREEIRSASAAWFSRAEDRLDAQEATRLLSELALEYREVIVARLWGELTFADIAELVGCSLPTAHRRYQTGLSQLRERLEGPCKTMPLPPTT
jgi:RNA polymerase sigma-70 factor (ECF subfamily)